MKLESGKPLQDHKIEKKRLAGLDCLRGCILISMILYHGTWDMVYILGAGWSWAETGIAHVWQQSICWSFILLSGFCWNLGKNKWKRGLVVFVAGAAVTLVTKLFMPENIILFGVLTMLGSCMLLMNWMDKVLRHCPPVLGAVVSFAAFIVTRNVNYGYLGFERWNWLQLPAKLYANTVTTYLGFIQPGFFSIDYFGIFPWLFLFVTGYFFYGVFQKDNRLSIFDKVVGDKTKWLEWLGRHSLLIYMTHQPVLYGILWLFVKICKSL